MGHNWRGLIGVLMALALVGAACQYDPSALTLPGAGACEGQAATHGFGYAEGVDPAGGSVHVGTDGDDVIVVLNGPVTVLGLGGDDLICVNDVLPTAAGSQIWIAGGEGHDRVVGSPTAVEACVVEVATNCDLANSGTIRALTYNVAGLPDVLSGSNPAVNTAVIGPRLNNYDLVLLQESWLTPTPNTLAPLRTYHEILDTTSTLANRSVSLTAPIGTDPLRPTALLSDGLNRFSHLPFEPVDRHRWTNCGDASADCLALKGFSMSRTTVAPGVVVDVYNLHMEAGGVDFALRGENVDELASYIETNSVGNALIVGGDFNLHLDEEPDASQFTELLTRGGLTDVCTALGCDQPNRIDKFLFRSSAGVTITPTVWENADPLFQDTAGQPLSDHDPVAVNFAWTAQ
jgi:hypothetical protein